MCTHQSNLSFKQLKLELELEIWLKIKKIKNLGTHRVSLGIPLYSKVSRGFQGFPRDLGFPEVSKVFQGILRDSCLGISEDSPKV